MKIRINKKFAEKLLDQIEYIARDIPSTAKDFQKELMSKIDSLVEFPYRNRQSIYSEDSEVRDLIFKGYVITYRIKSKEEVIEIFSLIKYQQD